LDINWFGKIVLRTKDRHLHQQNKKGIGDRKMNKIVKVLFVFLIIFNVLTIFAQNGDWKQIVIGQSTKEDAERSLGKTRPDLRSDSIVAFFKVSDGNLTITYSTGFCGPNQEGGWNLEKGIIDQITYYPYIYPKLKKFKLDKTKYKKVIEGDVTDIFTYISKEDGIKYLVRHGKIETIVYFPSEKFDNIRCSVINKSN
jgi:hypothetical protein